MTTGTGTAPSDDDIIRTIPDDLPFGVWVARVPGGELVHANRAFAEIMGMTARDDVALGGYAQPYGIHARSGELYPEERMPFVEAVRARTTITVDDIVIHRRDGRKVYVRATAKPVFDAHGAMTHVVIAFIDISREVEAEMARGRSEAELVKKERMEAVGKLASGIAHDFNNLLASVRGIASLLLDGERDPRRRADLALIEEAAASGAGLTRALLDYARRRPSRAERMTLETAVKNVVPILERSADRRVAFAFDFDSRQDLSGDLAMLEQVVMNLVVNACEAMPDGGCVTIRTLDVALDGAPATAIEVSDTGPGIDPRVMHRLFEPYTTTKGDASRRGAGLGLATVFGIVESHRGTIGVTESGPGGTTFRATFPALVPAPAPSLAGDEAATHAADHDDATAWRGSGCLLAVDDEAVVLEVTRRQLMSLGFSVVTAKDGAAAVERFRRLRADLSGVVLDMNMPGRTGLDVLRELRSLDPGVRVLVVSGNAATDDDLAVIEASGAFLQKPWSVGDLGRTLRAVLARA